MLYLDSLQHGFQHIFVSLPRTLCSVKSFSDVARWSAAKEGQVHSNKFQRRLSLSEECQLFLCMICISVMVNSASRNDETFKRGEL